MTKTKSLLSCILVLAMILSSLGSFVFAEDDTGQKADTVYERRRLYEEEKSLYEKIWLNEDGTRTLEYYGSPVKYYDKDGNILDKEYRIKETADSFVYEEDFKVIFPLSLSDGVKLIFENEEGHNETLVSSKPCGLENIKRPYLSEDSRVLTYEIDDNVSIEYLISDNGLKEYIVVKSYNGTVQYSSEIATNGLILEDNRLLNGEGELKAYLGEAIVFDKEERNNTIAEADTSLITKGRYLYTVTLTEEYLNSAEYPIRIDPSITLNTTGNIEDVSIVSTTTHSGTLGVLYIGRGASGAALRSLMRFPNLDLSGYAVNSATISIRDLMCEHTHMELECHEYTGNSWSESTTTSWSGCGSNMVGTIYDSHDIYYGYGNHTGDQQRYDFDITDLAVKWSLNLSNPSDGLIFKATNSYESTGSKTYKTFGSINQGTSSYRPVLTVNYTTTISFSQNCYFVPIGGSKLLDCTVFPSGSSISYYSNDPSIATVSSSGVITGVTSGTAIVTAYSGDGSANCRVVVGSNDLSGTYYIKNKSSGKYMQVENASTSAGAAIEQFSFTGNSSSRWELYYRYDGYYTIKSVESGLYIGVEGGANSDIGAAVKQYINSQSTSAQWAIISTESGAYRLIPRCLLSKDRVAVINNNLNIDGTDVTINNYTYDYSYNDEWLIGCYLNNVPCNLTSNNQHTCIPCAITNLAAYWCINYNYQFNCSSSESQEIRAIQVQNAMDYNGGSHESNYYIPQGFEVFDYSIGEFTIKLFSDDYWNSGSLSQFDWDDIVEEINANRPLLLGFAATEDSPYSSVYGHMTVCVGYEISSNGIRYVYVSDAIHTSYQKIEFRPETYNDFIAKVNVGAIMED